MTKLKLLIDEQEKSQRRKFTLLKEAWQRAQESPRYIAPGTDCSPGPDVVNLEPYCSIRVVNV